MVVSNLIQYKPAAKTPRLVVKPQSSSATTNTAQRLNGNRSDANDGQSNETLSKITKMDINENNTITPRENLCSRTNDQNQNQIQNHERPPKPIRRYYIDELGFYRYLDPDQRQYVCSNTSAANLRQPVSTSGANAKHERQSQQQVGGGDGGYEICFRAVRQDLGISHFDRTVGYEEWKRTWDDFMKVKLASSEPVTLNRELKFLVRSGIPHDYRCKVWSALIRMRTRSIRARVGEDIYYVILRDHVSKYDIPDYGSGDEEDNNDTNNNNNSNRAANGGSSFISTISNGNSKQNGDMNAQESFKDKCFKQIELDLLRTLPNNRHFENPNSRGIQRVRRVLRAYACFNPTVGYCQGMNRLAAMALLVLPEEEAFWCLVAITQCIMPKDYYLKPWLAQVDCSVLSDLLERRMPKLHRHLVNNDIQLTLFTWFFTIFVDGFRPELMLRIWDCFLIEGDKVLFRFALAILSITQDDLLEMNDFSTMSQHLSRLVSTRGLDMEQLFESKYT